MLKKDILQFARFHWYLDAWPWDLAPKQQPLRPYTPVGPPGETGGAQTDPSATSETVLADLPVDSPAKAGGAPTDGLAAEKTVQADLRVGSRAIAQAVGQIGAKTPGTEESGDQGDPFSPSDSGGVSNVGGVDGTPDLPGDTGELIGGARIAPEANRIIVQWSSSTPLGLRQQAHDAIGGVLLRSIQTDLIVQRGQGLLEVIQMAPGMSVEQAMLAYQNRPGVEFVERDWVVGVQGIPNDPKYIDGTLWGMESSDSPDVGPPGTTNSYGSQAEQAWAQGYTGSTKVVVGVIDEGIDYTHPDLYLNIWLNQGEISENLKGQLLDVDLDGMITFRDLNDSNNQNFVFDFNSNGYIDADDLLNDTRWENTFDEDGNGYVDDLVGWDFYNNDNNPYDGSGDDHGTHVAGTIGGVGDNGIGVSGVSQDVLMMSLKFLGPNGGSTSGAIEAINYYADITNRQDVDIVGSTGTANYIGTSNSWSGGGFSQSLEAAIVNGGSVDNLFIAAAGNDSSNNDTTARYPTGYSTLTDLGWDAVISVASITSAGALSSFSNYGATTVDIGAPGSSIYSTLPGGSYGTYSGTSMATPHVSGAAAVLAAAFPWLSGEELRAALLSSATYTPSLDGKTATDGRLDLAAAIETVNPVGLDVSIFQTPSSVQLEGGDTTSTTFSFRIEVDETPTEDVLVNYVLRYGTANAGDFESSTESSGSVTLTSTQTWADVSFTIEGDSEIELNENFFVDIYSSARIFNATAEGVILADDARIEGLVWNDLNQDGVYDTPTEQGLGSITVYLDANNNGSLDSGEDFTQTAFDGVYSFNTTPGDYQIRLDLSNSPDRTQSYPSNLNGGLEPDNYSNGSILNSQLSPSVVLSAVGSSIANSNVYSQQETYASTGTNAFASAWNTGLWNTGDAELRVDFSSPVNVVSIDAISDDASDFAHLRAYDINGSLIEEYITSDLGTGVSETMTISRPTNEISYVLASGRNGQFTWLDNLVYSSIEGDAPIQLSLDPEISTGNNFGVYSPQAVPVVSIDIDGAASVSENGTQFSFNVSLDTAPTGGDVEIALDVVDQQGNLSDEASIDKTSLVFTAQNWQTAQTVIVTGADDLLVDGDQTFVVRTSAVNSIDPAYNGLSVDDITATNTDNDQIREVFFEAVSAELTINPDAVYEQQKDPAVSGVVAAVRSDDDSGAVQSITEGVLINPAAYVASGETAVTGSVTGSYTDTHLSDSVSQTIIEVESGGKPSNRSTSLEHIWSFTNVSATRLTIEARKSGSGDETYNLEWLPDGESTWLSIGVLDPTNELSAFSTTTFSDLNVIGSGLLRVTTATVESGERNLDSLVINQISLEGPGSSTSGIDSAMVWTFNNLDGATEIHIEGWEDDSVDDFRFEYSSDGGLNWNSLGVLSGGTSTSPESLTVTLAEPLSASEVLVRAYDTDRSESDTNQGTLFVEKLYFKAEQTDLRSPVELTLASGSGPSAEDGQAPATFQFSRDSADLTNPLRIYFDFGGSAELGSDYTASGYFTDQEGHYVDIAAGSATSDLVITPIDDINPEGSETVALTLVQKDSYGYRIGVSGTAETEIEDNDLQSYHPLSLTLEAGSVQGAVDNLTGSDGLVQALQETESGGKPSNRYSYLIGVYDFGEVSNVSSFTIKIDSLTGITSLDYFALEYSLDSGSTWSPLIDSITTGPDSYGVDFGGSTLNTLGGDRLQVRITDTDQTRGERELSQISIDEMVFSTEPLIVSTAGALGTEITSTDGSSILGQENMIAGLSDNNLGL